MALDGLGANLNSYKLVISLHKHWEGIVAVDGCEDFLKTFLGVDALLIDK
jgi:hypothetical protein